MSYPRLPVQVFVLTALSFAPGLFAQTDKEVMRSAALADPTVTGFAQNDDQQITLESSEDGSDVVARFGFSSSNWILNLKVQAPVDNRTEVDLATDDGFTNKTSATFSVTREIISKRQGKKCETDPSSRRCQRYQKRVGALDKVCRSRNDEVWQALKKVKAPPCKVASLSEYQKSRVPEAEQAALKTVCALYNKLNLKAPLLVGGGLGTSKKAPEPYVDVCGYKALFLVDDQGRGVGRLLERGARKIPWSASTDTSDLPKTWEEMFVDELNKHLEPICREHHNPVSDPEVAELFIPALECTTATLFDKDPWLGIKGLRAMITAPWYITGEATAANNTFSYVDPMSFEDMKTSKTSSGWGVAVGHYRRGRYYSLGFRKSEAYKGADRIELCTPLEGTEAETCKETALEGPTLKETEEIQLDVKELVAPNLGLNLRMIHDFEDKKWEYHLLAHFLRNVKKGLNGGVDVSYDEEEDWNARLFIGASFKLSP